VLDPDKFKRELELQGITLTELSARSGMNYSHLSNLKNGKVKHVKFETLVNIARHLNNIPPYRLISDTILDMARQDIRDSIGSLPKKQWPSYLRETLEDTSSASLYVNRFPIIGRVKANGEHDLPTKLSRDRVEGSYNTVPFDGINDPDAYAVILEDQALSLDIKQGSVLLFAPKYKVDKLSLCLVRTKANDRIWVRYSVPQGDHYILMTKGEITEPIVLDSKAIAYMHRCVGHLLVERPLIFK
jgi:DNA-binding Xre family transcriptional regulator